MLFVLSFLVFGSGCSTLGPQEQRFVSKPNMLFADSGIFTYQCRLLFQTEPGAAFSGGARAAGCTTCR
jgi:hypothetical protein